MAKQKLTPDQIKYGSMYIAASNLGQDMQNVKSTQDIHRQWYHVMQIHGEEEIDVEPERKDWEKQLKRGDSYAVGVIQKELPFLFEDVKGMLSSGIPPETYTKLDKSELLGQDDGQPRRNYYVPSVMVERDVIANILDKFSKAGVTHTFQGDDLIINAGTYSTGAQADVMQELKITITEVLKFLKDEYKSETGKALSIGKEESETFDCVANYTTNHLSLCRLTCVYELPNSKAADDAGSEKGEIRGILPSPKLVK